MTTKAYPLFKDIPPKTVFAIPSDAESRRPVYYQKIDDQLFLNTVAFVKNALPKLVTVHRNTPVELVDL